MNIKKLLTISLAVCAALASCQKEVETVPESAQFIKFTTDSLSVEALESVKSISVSSSCSWTSACDASWLKVAPEAGTKATTTLTLDIQENTDQEKERVANITLTGAATKATLVIVQSKAAGPVTPGTEIYTADDFKTFLSVAKDFTKEDCSKVFNDIDMGGATIAPVVSYAGVFDGQNHRIYNFKVESSDAAVGLFLTNTGTIKNVVFGSSNGKAYDGVSKISAADGKGGFHCGLVASNSGIIENVKNFATVAATSGSTSETGIGGIVGELTGGSLKDCANYATVSFASAPTGKTYIGGVAGFVSGEGVTIEGCSNNAAQEYSFAVAKECSLGGVLARANVAVTITNCHNNADFSFTDAGESNGSYIHLAGVAGAVYNGAKISSCSNKGTITSSLLQVNRMGGVVGTLNSGGSIENCTNSGAVTLNQAANGNWQAVGGVLGFQEKGESNALTGCTNTGKVSASVENATTHANKVAVGGVTGIVCLNMAISGCKNEGEVSVTNKAAGEVEAGGIAGSAIKGAGISFAGNENSGNVSAATSDGVSTYAGGICGLSSMASTSIKGDKSVCTVSCGNTAGAGAIAGKNAGTVENCTVGGTVCGTALDEGNAAAKTQGSVSSGSATGTVFGGGGAEGKGIKTAADLKDFADASTAATPDFSAWAEDGVVKVLSDIDASSVSPLQIAAIPAGITLDGKGHKIFNLKVESSAANTGFIVTNAGTVKNLVVGSSDGKAYDGVSYISAKDGKGGRFFGLIAENNGTVDNVSNFATIKFVAPSDAATNGGIGGVVGTIGGGATVKNCTNHAAIETSGTLVVESYFGGVAGSMLAADATLSDCTNEAAWTVTLPVKKVVMAGGVLGRSNAAVTVENCHNKAAVKYTQSEAPSTWMCIGGVAGAIYTGTSMTGCDNTAEVSSDCQQVIRIGGILGVLNNGGTVSDCTNTGAVKLAQKEANANWQAAGGIVGFQEKLLTGLEGNFIKDCINKGAVTVDVDNATTHANKVAAGGIIGIGCLSLTISGNVNSGAVSINNKSTGVAYAGGIVGSAIKGAGIATSQNSNTGNVSAANSGDTCMAGGVVGLSDMASNNHTGDKSVCAVTCKNAAAAGALIGTNKGTATDCKIGGSVNGTAVTASNLETVACGSSSTGTATGTTLVQ